MGSPTRPRPDGDDNVVDRLSQALDDDVRTDHDQSVAARRRRGEAPVGHRAPELQAALRDTAEEIEEIKRETKKRLPNFVGSIIFHLILLGILSLIILFPYTPRTELEVRVDLVYEREELGDDSDMPDVEEFQDDAAPPTEVDAPEVERLHDQGEPAKVVSESQSNRFGRAKEDALRRYGGTPGSEAAVRLGLQWLVAHQENNGLWDPYGYQRHCPRMSACDHAGRNVYGDQSVGVSGLVMLAFAGNGHTPRHGIYRDAAGRGIRALLSAQDSDGCFGGQAGSKFMYDHSLALLAMIEMYGITGDVEMKLAAQAGLNFLARAQQRRDGGWDYRARQGRRSDMSVSGWCVMAMKSARAAGLEVSEQSWKAAEEFQDSMTEPGSLVRYSTAGAHPRTEAQELAQRGVAMQAVSLASRLFLGQSRDSAIVVKLADRIRSEPPDPTMVDRSRVFGHDIYYWYYGTLAMFQMGGSFWSGWNDRTRDMVVDRQILAGHAAGSWVPPNSFGGREAGRIYSTATCVLILETYYRYLPIYSTIKDEIGEDDEIPIAPSQSDLPDDKIDFAADSTLASALAGLQTGSLRKRVRAIAELGLSTSPNAAALLRETYREHDDVNVRRAVLKSLAQQGGSRSYLVFVDALESGDPVLVEVAYQECPRLTGDAGARDAAGWVEFLRAGASDR